MSDFYVLMIDQDLCVDCGNCLKVLPTFKDKHNGRIRISEGMYSDIVVKEAIKSAINICSENAIVFITM